ncbi:hypothetical protein CPter291_4318 [Collimonas pratensis]|uniref:Uncharacterized protein n=1 Tax=Collimonas pratensis TaxID=279113 RepID=A0A127Q9E1_9BURK|nr:hypothetical protein CPter91_4380 [Collimonas pratensis]AMP16545.1 hypothetical protein CPter291_4318 [Collimonas pratensis]
MASQEGLDHVHDANIRTFCVVRQKEFTDLLQGIRKDLRCFLAEADLAWMARLSK